MSQNPTDVRMAVAGAGFFAARKTKPKPTATTPIFDQLWDEQRPPIVREEN